MFQDLRSGVRLLFRDLGFTSAAVLTLALGIGATSSIFSIVNAVLLRPLPYEAPDRLVIVWERSLPRELPMMFASAPNFADWEQQATSFDEIGAFRPDRYFLSANGPLVQLEGSRVTSSVFRALKVEPFRGSLFTERHDEPGAEQVVLISHRVWQSQFGSDPNIVGKPVTINEEIFTILGVMPPGFSFPPPMIEEGAVPTFRSDIWSPFSMAAAEASRGGRNLRVIARLADGVSLERADEEMKMISRRLQVEYPDTNTDWDTTLVPLDEQVKGDIRTPLLILFGAVGLVLLIACVNVANLLLARGTARMKEFAIRASLGASRARLIRQSLIESSCLALLGGVAGLALAHWGTTAMVGLAPRNVPRLNETSVDVSVIGFTIGASLFTGLLFGLPPALKVLARGLNEHLKEGGRSQSGGVSGLKLRSVLVVAEVMLSLILLVGSGLLFQSFIRLMTVDKGFDSGNVLTLRMSPPSSRYGEAPQRIALYRRLEERLNALPGVESAGFIYDVPLGADRQGTSLLFEGETEAPPGENRLVNFTMVTPKYLDSIAIPLRGGRQLAAADDLEAEKVALINEELARRFFPDEDPLDKKILVHGELRRIVGIVGNVRHNTLRDDPNPVIYLPYYQQTWSRSMSLVARSSIRVDRLVQPILEEIARIDAGIPIYNVASMEEVVGTSLGDLRFSALMMAVFSGVALLLAAIGIYGVISYVAGRRIHETGIRIALGARSIDIIQMLLKQGLGLTLIGVIAGIAVSLVLARLLTSLLYGVTVTDPLTLVASATVLVLVALLATFIPARRATKIDPMSALRCE